MSLLTAVLPSGDATSHHVVQQVLAMSHILQALLSLLCLGLPLPTLLLALVEDGGKLQHQNPALDSSDATSVSSKGNVMCSCCMTHLDEQLLVPLFPLVCHLPQQILLCHSRTTHRRGASVMKYADDGRRMPFICNCNCSHADLRLQRLLLEALGLLLELQIRILHHTAALQPQFGVVQ